MKYHTQGKIQKAQPKNKRGKKEENINVVSKDESKGKQKIKNGIMQ